MVETVVAGVVAGTAGAVSALAYQWWVGCTGGHVWDEWEPVDRWQVNPFEHRDDASIKRQYRRECTRDDCTTEEAEYREKVAAAYATSVSAALASTTVVHYRCPSCSEVVAGDQRETEWRPDFYGCQARFERCPECCEQRSSREWDRVSWEDLDE